MIPISSLSVVTLSDFPPGTQLKPGPRICVESDRAEQCRRQQRRERFAQPGTRPTSPRLVLRSVHMTFVPWMDFVLSVVVRVATINLPAVLVVSRAHRD